MSVATARPFISARPSASKAQPNPSGTAVADLNLHPGVDSRPAVDSHGCERAAAPRVHPAESDHRQPRLLDEEAEADAAERPCAGMAAGRKDGRHEEQPGACALGGADFAQ